MTARAWLTQATRRLTAAGNEDAAFDAGCLLADLGGVSPEMLTAHPDTPLPEAAEQRLCAALSRREAGYPLQYLLGQWDFLSLTLCVGEGVLIPRPETELLCESVAKRLKGQTAPQVLDLCAGTGCVGLGIASLCPTAQVTAVELSEAALPYLRRNCAAYPAYAVTVRQGDVLAGPPDDAAYDAIVSNPPYIPTGDLAGLQREVQYEPTLALDGAADGLRFYRCLARQWRPCLRRGGILAAEIGVGQAPAVEALWREAGLSGVTVLPDYSGIPRVILGQAD